MTSKISDLLSKLNNVISQNLLDEDGYIITEEIEKFLKDRGPAHDFLVFFLKNEDFKIKCNNLEDFFANCEHLTKILSPIQITSRIESNPNALKNELSKINTLELEEFFKTLPAGFEIIIELILRDLDNKSLIKFLSRFESLQRIFPSKDKIKHFKRIRNVLNDFIESGTQSDYQTGKALIEKNSKLFPLLNRKIRTSYKVNEYITLKLENNQTNIYVKEELFNQCKYLLLNISTEDRADYKKIGSIDEAAEVNKLSRVLEGGRRNSEFKISPETEFWGHCSNIQAWAENDYNTCLLHRNLAFPLLHKLAESGDSIAQKVFKQEILKRLISGHYTVITYLAKGRYLDHITDDDLCQAFNDPQYELFENLIRGLANNKHFSFVKPIFSKLLHFFEDRFKEYFVQMLNHLDIKLYCGIMKTDCLQSLDREILSEFLNKPHCILKEFCYRFRGKEYFISSNLNLDLSNKGINDLKEIEGLHRLKHLISLDLRNNNIKQIFGLENLKNLKKLRLKGNLLSQRLLEILGGLDANGDAIIPQEFVDYCQTKASHYIECVELYGASYEVINGRLNLSKLGINNLSDIRGLYELNNLTHLDLSCNNLKNVDEIQMLTTIEYLNLSNNKITRFNDLNSLVNLKVIRLNGNNVKKIPNFKSLQKKKTVVDLDTPRKVSDKEYLIYLLQSLTINEMIVLCKQFNVQRYSKLTREKLIVFMPNALLEYEIRDVIRKIEQKVVSNGLKNALLFINRITSSKSLRNIQLKINSDMFIEIITTNWDKRQIRSTLNIIPSNLDNPHRHCECKTGKKMGFCSHYWFGVIFALKMNFFQLSDWTLTVLPKNLEDLIESIQINEIKPNIYSIQNYAYL